MAAWVMFLGMLTLINVTMVGAIMQLSGNIPDASLLVILSRYLRHRKEPQQALLRPMEASSRIQSLRRKTVRLAAVFAAAAFGFTIWALVMGWGVVGMSALTLWLLAANIAFLDVPLASFKRRASRMETGEAASRPNEARNRGNDREKTQGNGIGE